MKLLITNRFYITTIIAIFLSLSMGILIGGTLGQQWIQQNQDKVVSYFQSEADQLRKRNKEYEQTTKVLEEELKAKKEEISVLFNKTVNRMIDGKKILWVSNRPDEFSSLIQSLQIAGGINEQLNHHTTVFNSIATSEKTNQAIKFYDAIVYVPTSKEELMTTSTLFPTTTPVIILSKNTELNKTLKLNSEKVFYKTVIPDSVDSQYEFLSFLQNLFKEQNE